MSIDSATKFVKTIFDDEKLQAEIEKAIDGVEDSNEKAKRVAAIGKTHGFDFTPAEALAVKTAVRQVAIENNLLDDQLTDDELEIVSGGLNPAGVALTAYSFADGLKQDGTGARSVAYHSIKAGVSLVVPIPGVSGVVGAVAGGLLTGNPAQIGKDIKRTANTVANTAKKVFRKW